MMTDKTKSWNEIQEDFDRMQRMNCVPVDIKKVPENYVFDEDQSVKWNKEQVKINNQKYKEEVARLKTRQEIVFMKIFTSTFSVRLGTICQEIKLAQFGDMLTIRDTLTELAKSKFISTKL